MSKILSLFNHKGGVSKTTTTFNLGWALAERGHIVLLVDADPQCNLTGMALTLSGHDELDTFYEENPNCNLFETLQPAFSGSPTPLSPAEPVVTSNPNLFLLAGHIDVATYESELTMAHKLAEAMPVLQNLPGALGHLIRITGQKIGANYILVDLNPSIGALNQNVLIQSDFFIVPTTPDYFCYMAIRSLTRVLPIWYDVAVNLKRLQSRFTYKLPEKFPQFIGTISQRYVRRAGRPSMAFQQWINRIIERVNSELIPVLEERQMTISKENFESIVGLNSNYEIAQIADFSGLIARSQEYATPIYALSKEQLDRQGVVLERTIQSRDSFRQEFEKLAQDVERLCSVES